MPELYINDDNINDLDNCDYLSISKLTISVNKNINLLLDKLYKFINLEILFLYDIKITEINGLNNLSNLKILDLSKNLITEIKGLDNLINLQELYLYNNDITVIKGLDNLVNLQHLTLHSNEIIEIKGLDNLINLQELYLDSNQITKIKALDNLSNLKILNLSKNQITEIKGLDNLSNLQNLVLSNNQITEIKGLDNLSNLQKLILSNNQITEIHGINNLINLQDLNLFNNQITEIKGLNNLINLQDLHIGNNEITEIKGFNNLVNLINLYLYANQITEIKGLNNLINLQKLNLINNQITKIKSLDNLVNLQYLNLYNNQITELSLSLCNLRNIEKFYYSNNPIEHIPLPVQRWLDRLNNEITVSNMVYNDKQNIHNRNIQNSFRNSLNNIFKDKQLLDLAIIKQQILENCILTEQTKREILNYCDDKTMHFSYLITYSDLLVYVWSRIIASTNKDEIMTVLNQEISDGVCMCFTGRLTRLLNTLVGFYSDIELQISDSEQITNIIMAIKNKFTNEKELKNVVRKELRERQYSESIINEWLSYI